MDFYPTNVTLHIIFAGIWISFIIIEFVLKSKIQNSGNEPKKNLFIYQYIKFTKIFVIAGSIGITITGVLLVIFNSHYGFFNMTGNHWLATKQILFVLILFNTVVNIYPSIKKFENNFNNDNNNFNGNKLLNKIFKTNRLIIILVIINFLFAITHKFYT